MAKSKSKSKSKSKATEPKDTGVLGAHEAVNMNTNEYLETQIDNSTRLFGCPHQFLDYNDPRIGDKSDLGRSFAEKIIMEAPIICLKPGVPDFLPGMGDADKKSFMNLVTSAVSNSPTLSNVFSELTDDEDAIPYYRLKSKYSDMMAKVNVLCRIMATFIGISDKKVPWVSGDVTFGSYNWMYYTVKNQYGDVTMTKIPGVHGPKGIFMQNTMDAIGRAISNDTEWVRFYVDSSASFSESASNQSTTSILESFTEKLEGVAKELEVVSGISGIAVDDMAQGVTSSVDEFVQQHATGDGAIATFLKRITGATNSIISGGNVMIPEIWSQSEYSKSYSFSITLSTPYGCPEAWFLNIGVPMMHILGMCLPNQITANTYRSPYLVKCFSPGWFTCDLGLIDSVSIEKGSNSSWSVGGLPNEVRISLSVKDLYAALALPNPAYTNPTAFLGNTGMLEFLMANCGVDITHQDISDKYKVWGALLSGRITDWITRKPYDVQQFFKSRLQSLFTMSKW